MTAPVPAGPTDAQAELREEIARAVSLAWNPDQTWLWDDDVWEQYRKAADAVLALPTMRDALAAQEELAKLKRHRARVLVERDKAQETVRRVEALVRAWDEEGINTHGWLIGDLRRALAGES